MITTKNIIAVYKMATPDEIKQGIEWYLNATSDCKNIADRLSLPLHIVIGVLSALSPNNKWSRNLPNANTVLN